MPTALPRITLALSLLGTALMQDTSSAQNQACATRVNATHALLQECVTIEGVREHQAAFQAIADANGGTRAAGTPGYDASLQYGGRSHDRGRLRRHAQRVRRSRT